MSRVTQLPEDQEFQLVSSITGCKVKAYTPPPAIAMSTDISQLVAGSGPELQIEGMVVNVQEQVNIANNTASTNIPASGNNVDSNGAINSNVATIPMRGSSSPLPTRRHTQHSATNIASTTSITVDTSDLQPDETPSSPPPSQTRRNFSTPLRRASDASGSNNRSNTTPSSVVNPTIHTANSTQGQSYIQSLSQKLFSASRLRAFNQQSISTNSNNTINTSNSTNSNNSASNAKAKEYDDDDFAVL
jgi:hypothetical protein